MNDLISKKALLEEIEAQYDLSYGAIMINPRDFYDMADCQKVVQQANKWIPVSERLPNMEECQKNDCRFIVTDRNRVYEDSFDYMADGYIEPHWTYSTCQPTAWQPLPEPYKEENYD